MGATLVAVNRWFTVAFAVWSIVAVAAPPTRVSLAALDLVAFVAGCATFLVAYGTAIARSRTDAIGLGALFFLTDDAAPPAVRRSLRSSAVAQVVVGVTAAAVRPFTPVAFGVLVPMVGLGVMGLWGARHGSFPARAAPATHDGARMEQNGRHG